MRIIPVTVGVVLGLVMGAGCSQKAPEAVEVVVYTSVDQIQAKKVFDRFTEETGIKVLGVFDTEAQKTTGLYRRLLAERSSPRADVFWNGEICRTIQLAEEGLADDITEVLPADFPSRWVDPEGRWAAFSLRARVLVYNPELVDAADVPRTLEELAGETWKGKFAMANPVFGTTATHVAALYEKLGAQEAEVLLRSLATGARVVEGNAVVRDLVARGDVPMGLTDSDDFYGGLLDGKPLAAIAIDRDTTGTFVIPNSVMILAGAPHKEAARQFARFLLAPEVEAMLASARCRQLPVRSDVERPGDLDIFSDLKAMEVDYARVAARMEETSRRMDDIFGH